MQGHYLEHSHAPTVGELMAHRVLIIKAIKYPEIEDYIYTTLTAMLLKS